MTVLWIDVSHHDWNRRGGNLDWARVRAVTSEVMCARATYGDPGGWNRPSYHFADFQNGARTAGFTLRGGYHNLIAGDQASIARQVDWLRSELDAHGCVWAMADVEPYAELVSAGMWPRWEDVQRFHDRWYQLESRVCAWYIPRWFWAGMGDKGPGLEQPDLRGLRGPLVQSHYAGGDGSAAQIYANAGGDSGTGWDDFYGGRYPDIWQYTSGADVDGASTNTDANAFRGTLDELRGLLTGDDDMDQEQKDVLWANSNRLLALLSGEDADYFVSWTPEERHEPNALRAQLDRIEAKPPVQSAPVDAAALKAVLLAPEVLGAIAAAVLDEQHRRTAE